MEYVVQQTQPNSTDPAKVTWNECIEAILFAQLAKHFGLPEDSTPAQVEEYARQLLARWGDQ